MQMHDVIARGCASIRKRNGWTQEQAAYAYRRVGLSSWRTSTVGSLEAGLRHPGLEEVILMCAALGTTLSDLMQAAGERETCVRVSDDTAVSLEDLCRYVGGNEDGRTLPRIRSRREPVLPSESERHAARRLGTRAAEVQDAAIKLWGRNFDQERDARIGNMTPMEPRTRQARRGLASRSMLAEMRAVLGTGN